MTSQMRFKRKALLLLFVVLGLVSVTAPGATFSGLPKDPAWRQWILDGHGMANQILDEAIAWWEPSKESRAVLRKFKRARAALNDSDTIFHFPEGSSNWDECDNVTWALTIPKKVLGRVTSADHVYFCKVTWDFSVKALAEVLIHESVHVGLIDVQGSMRDAECSAAELTALAAWAAGYKPLWSKYARECGLASRFEFEHSPLR